MRGPTRPLALLPLISLLASSSGGAAPPGPAPSLPLSDVLATLNAQAPAVLAARARAGAAAAAATKARRLPNPTAEVRAENWRSGMDASTDLDVFATLAQPLPVFGTHGARKDEASALARSAAAEARRAEAAVLLEGARLYLAAARGRELVAALEESRAALAEVVGMTRKRVAEGWTAEGDLLKLESELARADGLLARSLLERDAAALSLGALLGSAAPVDPGRLSMPPITELPAGDAVALAREGAKTRPDVAAARERLEAARAALRLEKAARIPEPSLTAGYKRTGGLDTAVTGLSFPLPLFDTNAAGVARAGAEERAAALEVEALERSAAASGAALVLAARALAQRAQAAPAELVAPAEGARRAARAAFREGASAVLPLVDAERVTAEAVREALDLAVDARMKTLEARLALGQEVVP